MIKKLKLDAYEGAIRCGGFFAWFFTVMYLCESNMLDVELYESINLTFLTTAAITGAVLVILMLFLDFEGIMADKWLRWIPGLLMAESGVALSLSGTRMITLYAAIAGAAMVIGALGMLTTLMRVKVSQRIFSVGMGLAFGAIIRVLCSLIITYVDGNTGKIIVASVIGVIAAVTAHTSGYSKEAKPLLSSAEARPSEILRRLPSIYFWMLILGAAFTFACGCVESNLKVVVTPNINVAYKYFDIISYAVFALTAMIAVFIVKPHALASLFSFGSALALAASVLLSLQSPTNLESMAMIILCYSALACFRMCMYLLIVTFSLDRPHPLFYAVFGFGILVLSRLCGDHIRFEVGSDNMKWVVLILALLIMLGAILISRAMRYSGFSQEQLEKRHRIRRLISDIAEEKELTEREKAMLNLAVLDGYSADMMPDKLGVSRNTVKAQMRALTAKFDADSLDDITEEINRRIDEQEEKRKALEEQKAKEKSVLVALAGEKTDAQSDEQPEPEMPERPEAEEQPDDFEEDIELDTIDIDEMIDVRRSDETEFTEEQEEPEPEPEAPPVRESVTRYITDDDDDDLEPFMPQTDIKPRKDAEKAAIRVIRRDKGDKKTRVVRSQKSDENRK